MSPCEHDWMDRGTPGDEWRECFLCGVQADAWRVPLFQAPPDHDQETQQ